MPATNLDHHASPTARDDPWMAAMRRGDFSRAWEISDTHLRAALAAGEPAQMGPRHRQRVWSGEPLDGRRVLVRCYHGLGDTVQFIRFAEPLRRRAKEVIVWAQPALLSIVASAAGVDRVLPLHDGVPDVAHEVDIEIMELAHALRIDDRSIRVPVPYIHPPRRTSPLGPDDHRLTVGLVWRAGAWMPHRSLPIRHIAAIADGSPCRLVSLQRGPASGEAMRIPAPDLGSDDIEVTAATLGRLDLLITVDTFAAHLAGALGVRAWLLLAHDCDWRWLAAGDRTLWYPTLRLFRQPRPGDWDTVVDEVARTLRVEASKSRSPHSEQTIASDVRP